MIRLRPPRLDPAMGHQAALALAFASDRELPGPSEPDAVVTAARALGLGPRIAAETSRDRLARTLGDRAALEMLETRRQATARALQYEHLLTEVAAEAKSLGAPLIVLKGAALHAGGHSRPGARSFGDLDLLLAEDAAQALHARLVSRGFEAAPGGPNDQHLPVLRSPTWGVVDLHVRIPGLWTGRRWWRADEALAHGAQSVANGAFFLPSPETLAAHAIVHALDQHVFAPGPHTLSRVLADLDDLLPDDAGWDRLEATHAAALDPSVPKPLRAALRRLLESLRAGPGSPASGLEARLLAHLTAHDLLPDYRRRLRWRHRLRRLRQATRRGDALRYIRRKSTRPEPRSGTPR